MTRLERIGPDDLMQLASDVGPAPMNVGALLVLDAAPGFDVTAAQAELGRRLGRIPRLRQRLVRLPWVLGRPIWMDDPRADPARHITVVSCRAPGDRAALLESAMTAVTTPLPQSIPLWRAVLVTGLDDGRVGVVLVFHHVLADGVGGLAILAALADSATAARDGMPSRRPPTRAELLSDALRGRLAAVVHIPQALTRGWRARAELGLSRVELAPRCPLNRPTGPHRGMGTVRVGLGGIHDLAERNAATVNDVLLTAVTGAMATLLRGAGEACGELVVSVPVSARSATTAARLGNRVGVMPVRVPLVEPPEARLRQVAGITRAQKVAHRGSSSALVGPLFRLLAAVGLLRWFVDRQRLVNSFLTNIRGPAAPLRFAGVEVAEVVPVTVTAGNVTVAFAALSYAGSLTIAVIVDPDRIADVSTVTHALRAQFVALGIRAQRDAS
ncbi:MAG: wax ester/triacylglycerol synthase domain-containing protein [Dermatophilaceae bacterium]